MKFNAGIIKLLFKILIVLVIIIAIIALLFVIFGNLKMSTLGFDTIKMGDVTLGDLGLGDQKVKVVGKAALKLVKPDKDALLTTVFTDSDAMSADSTFSALPRASADPTKPQYYSLLLTNAVYESNHKIALTEKELGYVLNNILTSGQEVPELALINTLKLKVASSDIIKEGDAASIKIVYSFDVASITSQLPNIPVFNWIYEWPTEAYVVYNSAIVADAADGKMSLSGEPTVSINGLSAEESEALLKAISKTKGIEPAEGKTYTDTVSEPLENVFVTAINHIGKVAVYGINRDGQVNAGDIALGMGGIKDGEIWFISH